MKDSSLGRVVAVLISPTRTFRAIAERPTWLVPMLVLVVLGAAASAVVAPKVDWQGTLDTKLERADREVRPEALDLVVRFLEKHGVSLFLGASLLGPWGLYPLLALVFLLLFKWAGAGLSYLTSLGVVSHAFMPWAVGYLISIPLLLPRESFNLYESGLSNLTVFAGPETSLELWMLLSSVDLFSLWTIALLVMGYSVAAKVTRTRAALCVIVPWVIWVAFTVGASALD